MTYLLDTNVVSELTRPAPEPAVLAWWVELNASTDDWLVPAPVIAEMSQGVWLLKNKAEFPKLRAEFDRYCALHSESFLDWDIETARTWGELAHSLTVKRQPQPFFDSLIDAMGVRWGLTIATRNPQDFRHAETFNPWQFQA